jgi:hypothetical protein
MGISAFFRRLFGGESKVEKELDEARARHGIAVDKKEIETRYSEEKRMAEEYDVWEDLRHYRSNFLLGGWLSKKFRPVGEDKIKKQLAELQEKRQMDEQKRREEEEEGEE